MPRRIATHLWAVIRYQDALVVVRFQDFQNPEHVHIAFIDESLLVVRHLAANVAKVDVTDSVCLAVGVDSFVHIALRHLGDRAKAKLECVVAARYDIQEVLIHVRLVHEPR